MLYFFLNYPGTYVAFCQQPSRNLSLYTSVSERLQQRNLLQLWESVKCWLEQPEFSWLKPYVIMNLKHPQLMHTFGVKVLVSHTKLEKHQLAKSLQQSHTITHFCTPLSPVPSPSSSSSARPELCTAYGISQSSGAQTIFSSTPTLKVEFALDFEQRCLTL